MTNPAIDPLREGLVMSLEVNLGKRENLFEVDAKHVDQVVIIVNFVAFMYCRNVLLYQRLTGEPSVVSRNGCILYLALLEVWLNKKDMKK